MPIKNKQNVHLHGDLTLYPVTKKIAGMSKAKKAKIHVLQQSGVTGNRHEIVSDKHQLFRWENGGKEYVHGNRDFVLQHVGGDSEHGVQQISAGTYEVKREFEHDPWKDELRVVLD